MFSDRTKDRLIDILIGAVHVAFGSLVVGRALNSQAAMNIRRLPIVGPVLDAPTTAMRAAFNEAGYDAAGSEN